MAAAGILESAMLLHRSDPGGIRTHPCRPPTDVEIMAKGRSRARFTIMKQWRLGRVWFAAVACLMPAAMDAARGQSTSDQSAAGLFGGQISSNTLAIIPQPQNETSQTPARTGIPGIMGPADVIPVKLPVIGEQIERSVNGVNLSGYLVKPQKMAPQGALLLVPEWWGANKKLRDQADQLAAKGFNVLVVDLYGGKTTEDRREAARLMAQ